MVRKTVARDDKGRFVGASASMHTPTPTPAPTSTPTPGQQVSGEMRVMSDLMSRLQLANMASLQFDGNRDMYAIFGYKKEVLPKHTLAKYSRQDIATRIVDAPPDATWSNPPSIKSAGGEGEEGNTVNKEFQTLARRTKLWSALHRADRMSRMYPFSIAVFGFDDTGDLSRPLKASKADLLYVRAYGSRQVDKITLNTDLKNPRYGMPETYNIKFNSPESVSANGEGASTGTMKDLKVHYSRVIHVVENPLEDLVYGTPIIVKVFNLLDDLLKVAGGTSETYWLTGNRGMQANIDKEMDVDPADAAALSDEIEEYQHQLRRFIRTRGVDLKVLDSTVPNPTYAFEMIMALISGTTGIPRRILLGSEAGQLASEQDRANWADRIDERRALFATPWVLDPLSLLLQNVGLLPEGEIDWVWPSAFIQNPLEKGQSMAQVARAVGNLSRQTGNSTPMQLLTREESREVIGFEGDLDDSDLYELAPYQEDEAKAKQAKQAAPPGSGTTPEPGQTAKPNGTGTPPPEVPGSTSQGTS